MSSPSEFLNRAAELRARPLAVEALLANEAALYTFTWRDKNLVSRDQPPRPVWLTSAASADVLARAEDTVFLGLFGEVPSFAVSLPPDEEVPKAFASHGDFNDLRMVGPFVADEHVRLLAYARGVLHWHRHHRHCGKCGASTLSGEGGHVRVCVGCEKRHFPRTDPAIMALIRRDDSVLLARQPRWPAGMYSILAGFVEPGENVEEAVVREVREEVGLAVADVTYVRSQPWPFPASLMIGFAMNSPSGDIQLGDDELEEARWVSRDEINEENNGLFVPPPFSLAGQMIRLFLDGKL